MSPFLDQLWKIVIFIGIQFTLGRRGSFPYGLLVHFSLLKITLIVIISDLIQTVVLLHVLGYSLEKLSFLKKFAFRWRGKRKPETGRTFWVKMKERGALGIIVVAALPYGGGALSGCILASSMKMPKLRAFLYVAVGCIIGSIIFYLGFYGIVAIFN